MIYWFNKTKSFFLKKSVRFLTNLRLNFLTVKDFFVARLSKRWRSVVPKNLETEVATTGLRIDLIRVESVQYWLQNPFLDSIEYSEICTRLLQPLQWL